MASTVSMVRISRVSAGFHPSHLPPFAMWPAFPASDYYGGSVAMGVSPFRRSRISCMNDVQDDLGALFVTLRLTMSTLSPGAFEERSPVDSVPSNQPPAEADFKE